MEIIRLQNKTPRNYTAGSRDFQLLCRLYDCVINGVKFDIDSMKRLTDTHECRTDMLQLLQTKVGFFSSIDLDDNALRKILEAFPYLIKHKGSLQGIKEAINLFLQTYNLGTQITIQYTSSGAVIQNVQISDHTIIIGADSAVKKLYVLEEILKYVLPTGFDVYFYFFNSIEELAEFTYDTTAELVFTTHGIASMLRGENPVYYTKLQNHLLGATDTMELASDTSMVSLHYLGMYDSLNQVAIPVDGDFAIVGTHYHLYITDHWQETNYRGEFPTTSDIPNPVLYDSALVAGIYYVYRGSNWRSTLYRGIFASLTQMRAPATNDVLLLKDTSTTSTGSYTEYIYESSTWNACNYRGIATTLTSVLTPQNRDIVCLNQNNQFFYYSRYARWEMCEYIGEYEDLEDIENPEEKNVAYIIGEDKYYIYLDSNWEQTFYRGKFEKLDDVPSPAQGDLAVIDAINYYKYNGTEWVTNDVPVYMFKKYVAES